MRQCNSKKESITSGELGPFHPAATPTTTADFDDTTGGYTKNIRIVDPKSNLRLDPGIHATYGRGSEHPDQRAGPAAQRSSAHAARDGQRRRARTGFRLAANVQHFSGKPWAATAHIDGLRQGDQRVMLEPRGTRRLSAQTLVDLRVSRKMSLGRASSIELLLDVLNALDDTAEEALASDYLFGENFGEPTAFVDPRRAMFGVRVNFGQ